MDTEQQVRLNFLEEAEEYFEQLESILLDLATVDNRSQPLNEALRAAHSIKGSAGMMGFMPLSRVAHRLEDFLKILQARQIVLDTEIETLLLQAVDCLRNVKQIHLEGITIDDAWWNHHAEPIFVRLRDRLGDLTDDDENRLLSAEEDVDIGVLMFTSGVEGALNELEAQRPGLDPETLRQKLSETTNKLLEFGFIGQIEPFISLCESVQVGCQAVSAGEIVAFTETATSLFWQTQALVSLGRMEQLPSQIDWVMSAPLAAEQPIEPSSTPIDLPGDLTVSLDDLSSLQANLAALELIEVADPIPDPTLEATPSPTPEPIEFNLEDLSQLQATIAQIELPEPEAVPIEAAPLVSPEQSVIEIPIEVKSAPAASNKSEVPTVEVPILGKTRSTKNTSVRVPLEQFRQINNLFSSFILERNSVSLRLEQLQALHTLLQERMRNLDGFNQELRQWYDRASVEELVASGEATSDGLLRGVTSLTTVSKSTSSEFDALEMDSYSNLHLLAQEQMETIVKIQEVIADLDLTTQEMRQANSNLNYTSRSLQSRITRAQMRPFADIVGRFPRVVRDLSLRYGKQVNLRVEGESTLFERFALDALTDPLNHLLRNAFDHGIEDPETRINLGKPKDGTIVLRAMQRGNKAIVTIQDDGKGINFEKVRDRVRQHGIPEDRVMAMTRKELLDLIFEPGFSTADKVTELSGRGVGMDVVRANLKELQGDIQIETEPGQGSKFIISIPLTLSILRVMILETSGLVFAIPIEIVKELTTFKANEIQVEESKTWINWKEQRIPLSLTNEYWQFQSPAKPLEMDGTPVIEHPLLLVVGEEQQCFGFQIQRFWGEQEVAIRPVTSPMPLPDGFSGVTVLGDGRIVPIVDPIQLSSAIEQHRTQANSGEKIDLTSRPMPTRRAANRILVVDDSVHARRYLAISLEKAGYKVEQAKDGREAVDRLLGGLQVEAVICDVEMPRLDGYGVLSEIKRRSEFKDLPITMLTSRSNDKHRKLAMSLGATAYFSKPYNEQELLQTLQDLVQA